MIPVEVPLGKKPRTAAARSTPSRASLSGYRQCRVLLKGRQGEEAEQQGDARDRDPEDDEPEDHERDDHQSSPLDRGDPRLIFGEAVRALPPLAFLRLQVLLRGPARRELPAADSLAARPGATSARTHRRRGCSPCKHRQQSINIQVQDDKFSREVQTVAVFTHLDEDAAALEPARADGRGVVRLQRDLKPTVAVCSRTTTQKRR